MMKQIDISESAASAPQRPHRPDRRQGCACLGDAPAAAKRGFVRKIQPDSEGLDRPIRARKGPYLRRSLDYRFEREPVASEPAAPPCPTPGFNGAHYFVEVDPVSGAPRPFTGLLRCKWCGAGHRAVGPPSFRHRHVRRLRPVSREEEFRAVLEAL